MTPENESVFREPGNVERHIAHVLLILAIAVGVFARFKGLGKWPFSGDEFHTVQSVRHILERGIPEFPFGGFYMRGVLLQYLMAFSSVLGLNEEFSYRLVTVVFNLSAMPAVYLLGKKISGTTVACAATAIFSLSLWEIEFARYARMYAPFQAVFIWYVYYLYKAVIEGERRARWWMLGLSLLSLFLYEVGIFLLALNFLPLLFENVKTRLPYASVCLGFFLAGYLFLTADFTAIGALPSLPAGYHPGESGGGRVLLPSVIGFQAVKNGGIYGAVFSVFFLANLLLVLFLFKSKPVDWRDWRKRVCLVAIMLACAMNLFLLAFSIGLVFLVFEWINIEDGNTSVGRIAVGASLFNSTFVSAMFFVGNLKEFQIFENIPGLIKEFIFIFLKYPNVLNNFIYPWAWTFPLHFYMIYSVIFIFVCFVLFFNVNHKFRFGFLIGLLILMLLLVSISNTPYNVPRYTFFIYPLIVIIFSSSLKFTIDILFNNKTLSNIFFILFLGFFGVLSEDFKMNHVLAIDSENIFFRRNMNQFERVHFYSNIDTRGVAQEIINNLNSSDIVISRIRPVCYYLSRVDYVYYPESGMEFKNYSALQGTMEKWTGTKLIHQEEKFWEFVENPDTRIWLITPSENSDWLSPFDSRLHEKLRDYLFFTSLDRRVNVYLISTTDRNDAVFFNRFSKGDMP